MATFTGTSGNDVADAAGVTLTGFTGGSLALLQDSFGDSISGLDGDDTITGGSGDDTIVGGSGKDRLFGGDGNDTIIVESGDQQYGERYSGGNGSDTLLFHTDNANDDFNINVDAVSSIEEVRLQGNSDGTTTQQITLDIDAEAFKDDAGGGPFFSPGKVKTNAAFIGHDAGAYAINVVIHSGFTLDLSNATFSGQPSDWVIKIGDSSIIAGGGNSITGTSLSDAISGGGDNDTMKGIGGADTLDGDAGNDTIIGGLGSDKVSGGEGDDLLQIVDGDAQVNDSFADRYAGNNGTDTLSVTVSDSQGFFYLYDDTITSIERFDLVGNEGTTTGIFLRLDADQFGDGKLALDALFTGSGSSSYNIDVKCFAAGSWDFSNLSFSGITSDGSFQVHGSDGDDTITGTSLGDWLAGSVGADLINGASGNDNLEGSEGKDTLNGGADNDTLSGGDGDDALDGGQGFNTVDAGAGDDTVFGASGSNIATGGSGTDTYSIAGAFSNYAWNMKTGVTNFIAETATGFENGVMGNGNDTVTGNDKDNLIAGGDGDDRLSGGLGADTLNGGQGNDALDGGLGNNTLNGGIGDDTVNGVNSGFAADGGDGVDTLDLRGNGLDFSWAMKTGVTVNSNQTAVNFESALLGSGNDSVSGTGQRNLLEGNAGNDTLNGLDGGDTINGGAGDDFINGGHKHDVINGGDGNDLIFAASKGDVDGSLSSDVINGNAGNDTITGSGGGDTINGTAGNDVLRGRGGDDRLSGGSENDTLNGGLGNDTLTGALGKDALTGGDGKDVFDYDKVVQSGLGSATRDVISDFNAGTLLTVVDRIDLTTIDAIAGGADNPFSFVTGAFTAAGQVHVIQSGNNAIVEVNLTGTSGAEMQIVLTGLAAGSLNAGDFIL